MTFADLLTRFAAELALSARVVVSMGMPALFYTVVYRAHSLKSLKRNILRFAGFAPVRHSIIGGVEGSAQSREK
jgi:hypothetical protein